jgi:hypothetical protein
MKILAMILLLPALAIGADVSHKWDAVVNADGYRLYQSIDNGITWAQSGADAVNTTATALNVPDSGLVLFKVSAFNAVGETIREWSGSWYNGDWKPVNSPSGNGIE